MTEMKSVGRLFQDERKLQHKTLEEIAKRTKIHVEFLSSIESDDFSTLPQGPFIKGFIRTYALELGLDPEHVLAIYRRDFGVQPQQKLVPDGVLYPLKRSVWRWFSPKTLGACIVACIAGAFLIFQLISLQRLPILVVSSPSDNASTKSPVLVKGRTDTDAVLTINDTQVSLDQDGEFQTSLELLTGDQTITVRAENRKGKSTIVRRSISVVQ